MLLNYYTKWDQSLTYLFSKKKISSQRNKTTKLVFSFSKIS